MADFNNDNKDDIAVGAPMEGEDEMNKVDVGAVYIYYGTLGSVRMCMRLFQHTCTVEIPYFTPVLNFAIQQLSIKSLEHKMPNFFYLSFM